MIRLIIFFIGAVLLWILFLSGMSKRLKIILSLSMITILIAGVWYDNYGETPRNGLLATEQIVSCGVTAEHSYRSDYKIRFCLMNKSKVATSKRLELRFVAFDCSSQPCKKIESVIKEVNFEIAPEQQVKSEASLAFDLLLPNQYNIEWKVEVVSVKAVK